MKLKAAEYARAGITPTQARAESVISQLMQKEHVAPRPGRDIIEFYARELIALSKEALDDEAV